MEKEIWKDIIGYEGLYQISNLSRVKSTIRAKDGKILKQTNSNGYLSVGLRVDKIKRTYKVHRLVAVAFIENTESKPFINHKNGVKNDNRIENLEWCTHKENMQHSFRTGLNKSSDKAKELLVERNKMRTGAKHYMSKIVLNTQTGVYYDSLVEAACSCSTPASTLYEKLNGRKSNNTNFIYA